MYLRRCIMVAAVACSSLLPAEVRQVMGTEQAARLIGPKPVLKSADCGEIATLDFMIEVRETGVVASVKVRAKNSYPAGTEGKNVAQRLLREAKSLLLRLQFRPFIVGSTALPVKALFQIPCQIP